MPTWLKLARSVLTIVRLPFVAAGPADAVGGTHIVVATRPSTPVSGNTPHDEGLAEPLLPESYSFTPDPDPMVSVLSPNRGTEYRPLIVTFSCTSRVTTPPP